MPLRSSESVTVSPAFTSTSKACSTPAPLSTTLAGPVSTSKYAGDLPTSRPPTNTVIAGSTVTYSFPLPTPGTGCAGSSGNGAGGGAGVSGGGAGVVSSAGAG